MTQAPPNGQIRWRCHRGMLELDLILIRFFDKCYEDLPEMEKEAFVELLEEQDPKLFYWFMHPEEASLVHKSMVEMILNETKGDIECRD